MVARVPSFTKAFAGRWRIIEMDAWDNDILDIGEEAHITFDSARGGEIAFIAVNGILDVRYKDRDGATCAEFSWQGFDENDEVCGRGWAAMENAGRLVGHIFIHQGDESGFVCERA